MTGPPGVADGRFAQPTAVGRPGRRCMYMSPLNGFGEPKAACDQEDGRAA